MNLTGACRNCLAKWVSLEAWKSSTHSQYKHLTYADAKKIVYGDVKIAKPAVSPEEMVCNNSKIDSMIYLFERKTNISLSEID